MGRPKLEIKPDQVVELAKLGASNVDIARFFDCSEATIRQRFAAETARGHAERRIELRRWQWKAAAGGNVAMLIWLGKQYLGQSDKLETKNEVGPAVDREAQRAMLSSAKALDLACDLEREIIRARRRGGDAPGQNGFHSPPAG
jgi:hypothetical protein